MNFIMNLQTLIKQWNQYLKLSQMPNFWCNNTKTICGGSYMYLWNTNNHSCPRSFFENENEQTNAILLLIGTIIHFLLALLIDRHTNINNPNSIIYIWPNIQFIIIDEISMVGCTLLAVMNVILHKYLKSKFYHLK